VALRQRSARIAGEVFAPPDLRSFQKTFMLRKILLSAGMAISLHAAGASAQALIFAGPGGAWQKLMEAEVIAPFRQQCGCEVRYLASTSNESLARIVATKASPEIDVMYSGDLQQVEGSLLDLFEPLDTVRVPNLANIHPNLRAPVPTSAYLGLIGGGLIYNRKLFAEKGIAPPTSVKDLLKPEFRNRVVVEGASSNYGMGMLVLMAKAGGGGTDDIEPGFAMARQLRENVAVFARNPTDTTRALQQESAWIGWWGDSRAYTLADTGFPIGYVHAVEGIPPVIMGASVVKGSAVTANAYRLVDYLLTPAVQAKMAELLSLGPTVKGVTLPAKVSERVIDGPEINAVLNIDWTRAASQKDAWIERWNREIQR
jgi:putative spermidine/putrescine transport system substrate-binding protein